MGFGKLGSRSGFGSLGVLGKAGAVSLPPQFVLIAGQSNALTAGISGATGLPAGWGDTSRVQMWNGSAFATYSPAAATNWGPEVNFAVSWLADTKNTGRTLYLLKSALSGAQLGSTAVYGLASGTGVPTTDWDPTSTGELFDTTKASVASASAALVGLGLPGNLDSVLWFQGESDALLQTLATDYKANLTNFIAQVRAQYAKAASAKFLISQISQSSLWTFYGTIRSAEQQVCFADANSKVVNTDGLALQADNKHFTTASINTIGANLYLAATGAYSYPMNADTTAFFSAVARDGLAAVPSVPWQYAYDNLVSQAKTNAWWAKCDVIRILGGYDSGVSLRNLRQDAFHAGTSGTVPTFTAKSGFACTAGAITSTYNPTTAPTPQYTQNSAHYGIWSNTAAQNNNGDFNMWNGSSGVFSVLRRTTDQVNFRVNSGANTLFANTDGSGDFVFNRSASAAQQVYRNASNIGNDTTTASVAVVSATENIGALNGTTAYSGRQYKVVTIGSSLSSTDVTWRHQDLTDFFNTISSL